MLATLPEPKTVRFPPAFLLTSFQALAFRRQGYEFALPMSAVRELITVDQITPSESGKRLKGVCRVGKTSVPVLELVPHASVALERSCTQLIVVSSRSQWVGLVYDQIVEICSIRPSQIASNGFLDDDHDKWPELDLDHGQAAYLDPAGLVKLPELALLGVAADLSLYERVG